MQENFGLIFCTLLPPCACPLLAWLKSKELAALLLSMVAELWMKQSLVITLGFFLSFLWNRSCQTSSFSMLNQRGIQPSTTFEGGLDDLEGFQAWAEEIKTYFSQANPALCEVLEHTASSKQPIDEESMIKTSQDIMKDKHKALRVLQAKIARTTAATTFEEDGELPLVDKEHLPEADERTEYDFKLELERNQLQVKNEGRQLGYLLVQKTKGEAQLQVRRWFQSSNGWETWRQHHLLYATSKRSTHFKLLASLMNPSFDTQPASFLQQFNAWKEQVVRCQQLSGENLPDFIKLIAVVNGLKGNVRHFVLLQLDGDSSFGDLDSLLGKYFNNTYVQSESSLNSVWTKLGETSRKERAKGKARSQTLTTSRRLAKEAKEKAKEKKGKAKEKANKPMEKEKLTPSQPPANKGKGKQQLPKREQWCDICWKKGHSTQACWWNTNQQPQQHQQDQAWHYPNQQQQWIAQQQLQQKSAQASAQRQQPQVHSIDQQTTYTSLTPDNQTMLSYGHQSQASTQPVCSAPVYIIAMLKSFPSSKAATTWGILVDTRAATSVAPKSFASDVELSPAPSALQLTTATGKAIKTYGMRTVHLHSQGLSLKVTFVIADVVTPLLGLDTILKDSLSLHVGQNLEHILVNPVGGRTKLEHMGKHLYLIACPSQHGSSSFFLGNLSQVIGFLPADKELQTQKSASRSSSSPDLEEEPSKQLVEQDSLNVQCHPVLQETSDEDGDPSFDLVPAKEEVADTGGEPQATSFHPKYLQQPRQPSKQERELHNMTHITFQPWCVVCQEAKGRASQHKKQKASTKTSKIQLDYAYIRRPQDKEPTTILTWVESLTGLAGSLMTRRESLNLSLMQW